MSPKTPENLPDPMPEELPPEDLGAPEGGAAAERQAAGSGSIGRLSQLTALLAATVAMPVGTNAQPPAGGPDRDPARPGEARRAEEMPSATSIQYLGDLQGALSRAKISGTPEGALAETLSVGTAAEWRKTLETIGAEPPALKEANRPPLLQSELEGRFQSLKRSQGAIKQYVLDVYSYTKKGQRPPLESREIYLRSFARYLDSFETYELYVTGRSTTTIPPYLKEFLRLKPEENASLKAAERFLPLQYDVARDKGLTKSPRELAPLAGQILAAGMRKSVTVGQLLTLPPEQMLPIMGYRDELMTPDAIQALGLLKGYVEKYRAHLLADVSKLATRPGQNPEETVQRMTLAEAMMYLHDPFVGEFAEEAATYLRDRKTPDLARIMDRLSEKGVAFSKHQTDLVFVPLAEANHRQINTPEGRTSFQKDTGQIMEFVRSDGERVTLDTLEVHIGRLDQTAQPLLLSMRSKLMEPASVDGMLKACFLPAENTAHADLREAVQRDLTELIGAPGSKGGSLKLRDAFELYLLSSSQSNPLLRAAKITQILKKYNKPSGGKLQAYLIVILQDAALNNGQLPDTQLSDDQKRELNNVTQYLAEAGMEKTRQVIDEVTDLIEAEGRRYPYLRGIILAVLGLGVGYGAYLRYLRFERTKLTRFANMEGPALDAFVAKHKLNEDEIRTLKKIQEEMKKVLARQASDRENTSYIFDVRNVRRNWNTRFGLYRADLKALKGAALSQELDDFAKALRPRYGDAQTEEAARILAECTPDMDAVEKALKDAGFPEARVTAAMGPVRREAAARRRAEEEAARAEDEARRAEDARVEGGRTDVSGSTGPGAGPAPSGRIGGGGAGPRTGDSGVRTNPTGELGRTGDSDTRANPDTRTTPGSDPNPKKK